MSTTSTGAGDGPCRGVERAHGLRPVAGLEHDLEVGLASR